MKPSGGNAKFQSLNLSMPPPREDGTPLYVMLFKDNKTICRTKFSNVLPFKTPTVWKILDFRKRSQFQGCNFPQFQLFPAPQDSNQRREWGAFMSYLQGRNMVAVVRTNFCSYYIHAPDGGRGYTHCIVIYRMRNIASASDNQETERLGAVHGHSRNSAHSQGLLQESQENGRDLLGRQALACSSYGLPRFSEDVIADLDTSSNNVGDEACHSLNAVESVDKVITSFSGKNHSYDAMMCSKTMQPDLSKTIQIGCVTSTQKSVILSDVLQKNFVRTDPSYLKTLSQTHSGWIFGALAELVDNSRDAHATRIQISIEQLYSKIVGKKIPVLSIVDDGDGMSHNDIVRMLSFGHKPTGEEDQDRIGRFGIGFKTGAMKLGRDALILSQSVKSRSVALLSQSYNENKDNIEIPIVSYSKNGQYMEIDVTIQSEESANFNLNAIKEYSPFNEYLMGEKLGLFGENGTGAQIFIWNLDEWGSDYTFEWISGQAGENGYRKQGDILIRSRRIRSRLGQISHEVPLDYSLRAYLEVIFLNPRMKIYVQGSLAYKRVGGMKHNASMGRGVLGVTDITSIMDTRKGQVWVLNNKQGFQDCEPYAKLEDWLGCKADEYWDENFDTLHLEKGGEQYEPDHSWVQCDKCRKWRMLCAGFDSRSLPLEWFCYMQPFNGDCDTPEQQMAPGVVTVAAKRSHCDLAISLNQSGEASQKVSDNFAVIHQGSRKSQCTLEAQTDQSNVSSPLKRMRRGLSRNCKKS